MAVVQCPNCGANNPNGGRLLARCRQCRAYLAACRYCRYYDARMMDCTHPARPEELRITDPSESLNCSDFTRLAGPAGRTGLRVLRTAIVAGVLVLGALFAIVRGYQSATSLEPTVLLRTTVSSTSQINFGEGTFDVKAFVRNEADHRAREVQVFISGPGLVDLNCEQTDPPEAYAQGPGRSVCGWIGDLEPGDIGSVVFHFRPREPCQIKLTAQVTAANLEGPERIVIAGEVLP